MRHTCLRPRREGGGGLTRTKGTCNRNFVSQFDLVLLQYILWDDPAQTETVRTWVRNALGEGCVDGVEALEEGMQAVFRRTCELYDSALYMRGDSINKRYTAYRKAKMKTFYSDGKEPSDAEAREARAALAAKRRREVAEIRAVLAGLEADLLQLIGSKMKSLGVDGLDVVSSHIWLPADFKEVYIAEMEPALEKAIAKLEKLLAQVVSARGEATPPRARGGD